MGIVIIVMWFIAGIFNLIMGDISRFSYAFVWIALLFNLVVMYFGERGADDE